MWCIVYSEPHYDFFVQTGKPLTVPQIPDELYNFHYNSVFEKIIPFKKSEFFYLNVNW